MHTYPVNTKREYAEIQRVQQPRLFKKKKNETADSNKIYLLQNNDAHIPVRTEYSVEQLHSLQNKRE
jgi:hypothetical protein